MKKILAVLLLVFCLVGCGGSVTDKPSISGTVVEVYENSILIDSDGSPYYVSLSAENPDNIERPISVGDEVTVYFDGNVAESYPMQIHKVYAITVNE